MHYCLRVGSGVQMDAKEPPTTGSNMQQGVQTGAICNIQQCCIRLRVALHSVETALLFKQSLAFR